MMSWLLAAAPAANPAPNAAPQAGGWGFMLIMILPFALMWFMMNRSQKKQQEAHRRMIAALKKGDRVVTTGGIIGEVVSADEDEIRLRIADKVETRFVKSAIARVIKG